jgi:mandelamide amidase
MSPPSTTLAISEQQIHRQPTGLLKLGWTRYTALHYAAAESSEDVLRALLTETNAGVSDVAWAIDQQDSCGNTALHWAASAGDDSNVALLLEFGADTHIKNYTGMTAAEWAQARNATRIQVQLKQLELQSHRKQTIKRSTGRPKTRGGRPQTAEAEQTTHQMLQQKVDEGNLLKRDDGSSADKIDGLGVLRSIRLLQEYSLSADTRIVQQECGPDVQRYVEHARRQGQNILLMPQARAMHSTRVRHQKWVEEGGPAAQAKAEASTKVKTEAEVKAKAAAEALSEAAAALALVDEGGLSAVETIRLIHSGKRTCVSIVKSLLGRIRIANGKVNACIEITDEAALLGKAAEVDMKVADGGELRALEGLPMLVKLNIDTAGMLTTAATASLLQHRPTISAPVWQRLEDAGALLVAKTNMPELAGAMSGYSPVHGHCYNPHAIGYSSGGSSAGTAAAIAAGMAPCGLGSDTAGSLRIPAENNGICGMRPSPGRYPLTGCVPLLHVDTPGPMGRTVADLALLDSVMAGADAIPEGETAVPTPVSLANLKICIPTAWVGEISPGTREAMEVVKRVLEAAGAEICDGGDAFAALDEKLQGETATGVAGKGPALQRRLMDSYLASHEGLEVTTDSLAEQLHWSTELLKLGLQSPKAIEMATCEEEELKTQLEPYEAEKADFTAAITAYFTDNNIEALLTPGTFGPPVDCEEGEWSFTALEEAFRAATTTEARAEGMGAMIEATLKLKSMKGLSRVNSKWLDLPVPSIALATTARHEVESTDGKKKKTKRTFPAGVFLWGQPNADRRLLQVVMTLEERMKKTAALCQQLERGGVVLIDCRSAAEVARVALIPNSIPIPIDPPTQPSDSTDEEIAAAASEGDPTDEEPVEDKPPTLSTTQLVDHACAEGIIPQDKSTPIIVYSGAGVRADLVIQELSLLGYTDVINGGGRDDVFALLPPVATRVTVVPLKPNSNDAVLTLAKGLNEKLMGIDFKGLQEVTFFIAEDDKMVMRSVYSTMEELTASDGQLMGPMKQHFASAPTCYSGTSDWTAMGTAETPEAGGGASRVTIVPIKPGTKDAILAIATNGNIAKGLKTADFAGLVDVSIFFAEEKMVVRSFYASLEELTTSDEAQTKLMGPMEEYFAGSPEKIAGPIGWMGTGHCR